MCRCTTEIAPCSDESLINYNLVAVDYSALLSLRIQVIPSHTTTVWSTHYNLISKVMAIPTTGKIGQNFTIILLQKM